MQLITGPAEELKCTAAGILKRLLADEFILYAKTRECHWNAVGPRFHDLQGVV